MNLAFGTYLFTLQSDFLHGADSFISPLKTGVLRTFITLKNTSPQPGLNPRTFEPMATTLLQHRGEFPI
jgi:hypothetical protein